MDTVTYLKCVSLECFGYKVSKRVAVEFLQMRPADASDREQLKRTFVEHLTQSRHKSPYDQQDRIRQLFLMFDVKGQGYISEDSFLLVVNKLMPHLKVELARSLYRHVDTDRNGCVTFEDFQKIMLFNRDDTG